MWNISKWETFLFIKLTPTPLLSGGCPRGRTPRFPSLTGYDVWMKALSPAIMTVHWDFQGPAHDNPIFCVISWLSSWMKILAALKHEVSVSCSVFWIVPEYVSLHLMKSNSSFTPLNSATFFLLLSPNPFHSAPYSTNFLHLPSPPCSACGVAAR